MLELHTWGPAFGLPSIDAECLAIIHYFRHAVSDISWSLVPSSNPNLNPFHRLPALKHGSTWVAGFDEIIQYLRDCVGDAKDLDAGLNDVQRADRDAYTSFLYSRGIPLLDLSLYVSSDNYTTCTRSVLGDLLSWPQSWTVPHELRDRAKRRSEHLGLSALDVDTVQDDQDRNTQFTAKIPKSLRKPKQTVSAILGRGVQKTRFRLNAVIEEFLEPLQSKLGSRNWMIAETVSSVDCLAIAIISLMQISQLPQAWLRDALNEKYTNIDQWATSCASAAYDNIATDATTTDTSSNNVLPWKTPAPTSWRESSTIAIETIISTIPLLRWGYECHELPQTSHDGDRSAKRQRQKQEVYKSLRDHQRLYSQAVFGCICTSSVLGYMISIGLLTLPRLWSTKPSRRNFGEAGAFLGL